MIIGVVGVAVGLTIGGLALYAALTLAVNRTLDAQALGTAREVAALVEADRLPDPVPVSGAQVVQVVDARGRVVGASVNGDRLTPLLRPEELRRAAAGETVVVSGARTGITGPLRVSAVAVGPPGEPTTVLVALQVGDVLASRSVLRTALLVTIPLLLLSLALVAWRVIGWTLRPVEALRLGAERISGAAQSERLPVPRATDEIGALALTLNGMLDRLAAARGRQRDFVADAAHELRSPLTSMRTQLEVAQRLGEGGELPGELLADVVRLTRLVEDLLLLARADADQRGPAALTLVDPSALLSDVAAEYAGSRVPVVMTPGPPVLVCADREELRRAVTNLVDNALRFAATQVRLVVEVDRTDDQRPVVLGVIDDGPGIPEDERERVFDRFARRDDARSRDAGGSGLGLAITRELVQRAGGSVRFVTEVPGQLRAEIRLPQDEPS
jgi:signal transduction histidine kinase